MARQDWIAEVDSGTPYDINRAELRILQGRFYAPRGRDSYYPWRDLLSHDETYQRLQRGLHRGENKQQRRAHGRLRRAWNIPTWQTTPDLYIKIFNDLDFVLFNGELYRRVRVSWKDLSHHHAGPTAGLTCPRVFFVPWLWRVRIYLDYSLFSTMDKPMVWGTLIHEMLHAYLEVTGNRAVVGRILGNALGQSHCEGGDHCRHFQSAARELAYALDFGGLTARDIT